MHKIIRIVIWTLVLSLIAVALPALAQEDLTESFTTGDGSLSFDHPADWHAVEFFPGMVLVGNSEAATSSIVEGSGDLAPNDMIMTIVSPQVALVLFGGVSPASLEEAFATLIKDAEAKFNESERTTFAGYDALIATTVGTNGDGVNIAIDVDGEYILINAAAAPGKYDQYADTVLAVVDTLAYELPEDMVTWEGQDIAFDYPAGWTAFEVSEGSYMLTNDLVFEAAFRPGQVLLTITAPDSPEIVGIYDNMDVAEFAREFAENFNLFDSREKEFGDLEDVTIGMYEGVQITFSNETYEALVVVLAVDNSLMAVSVATSPGELADFETDIMSIIESIELISAEE